MVARASRWRLCLYVFTSFIAVFSILLLILNVNVQGKPNNELIASRNQRVHSTSYNTDIDRSSYAKRISKTKWKQPPPGTQMGILQVSAIQNVIPENGNVLVWGLGNDSPFWHDSTTGKVVFLEHVGEWYDKIIGKYSYLESYKVQYSTDKLSSYNKYINHPELWLDLDIRSQLPASVLQTPWHVIIVDAPPGTWCIFSCAPGRYQSIYTSSLLARNGTHVFVDDYEREVERAFSLKMLGTPVEVVKRTRKGIFLSANEQAHFVHTVNTT